MGQTWQTHYSRLIQKSRLSTLSRSLASGLENEMRATVRPVLIVAMLAIAALSGCSGSSSGATKTQTASVAQSAPAPAAGCLDDDEVKTNQVDFRSGDGSALQGFMIGDGAVGVVLANESSGDLCQWKPYAYALSQQKYRVLAFNFGAHIDQDVVGATAALRAAGSPRVVLIGASMGATAVLAAAAQIAPPVSAVVSLSGPSDFDGVHAQAAVARLTMPALFLAGADDQPFANNARTMYRATHAPDRQLLIVPSSSHGVALLPVVDVVLQKFVRDHSSAG